MKRAIHLVRDIPAQAITVGDRTIPARLVSLLLSDRWRELDRETLVKVQAEALDQWELAIIEGSIWLAREFGDLVERMRIRLLELGVTTDLTKRR